MKGVIVDSRRLIIIRVADDDGNIYRKGSYSRYIEHNKKEERERVYKDRQKKKKELTFS